MTAPRTAAGRWLVEHVQADDAEEYILAIEAEAAAKPLRLLAALVEDAESQDMGTNRIEDDGSGTPRPWKGWHNRGGIVEEARAYLRDHGGENEAEPGGSTADNQREAVNLDRPGDAHRGQPRQSATPATPSLDVERLARAMVKVGFGGMADSAPNVAAAYAAQTPEGE
jgi:hypothetical protein